MAAVSTLINLSVIRCNYNGIKFQIQERHDLADTLDVASLLALPGVTRIVESELDPDVLLGPIDEAVDEAIDNLIAKRKA